MGTLAELKNKLRSPENKVVLQAVEELRARGWLSDGSLHGIALCKVNLEGADLMGADLSNVDFHQAHLDFADLSMTNLRAAKLSRAYLIGANFSMADLSRADLYKANFRGARNLTDDRLMKALRLWGATMPDGQPYDGRYNLLGDLDLAHWRHINVRDSEAMAEFFGVSVETYKQAQRLERIEAT